MPVNNSAASVRLSLFYKVATSGAEANAALSGPANHIWGVINVYEGAHISTPIHSLAVMWRNSSTTPSCPGITTLLNNSLIVCVIAWSIDNAGPLSSGETNAGLGSLSERYDGGTITGNGGGLIVLDGTLETRTTIAQTPVTLSSAAATALATFAIQDIDATLPTLSRKTRAVNTGM